MGRPVFFTGARPVGPSVCPLVRHTQDSPLAVIQTVTT